MSLTPPSFDRAEYVDAQPYSAVPDPINAPSTPDTSLFAQAILCGIGGALLGAVLDGGFIALTHINIGYLALVVAWLVAKAMTLGSRGQGGLAYQVSAILLTYLSVSAAHSGLMWWEYRTIQHLSIPFTPHNLFVFAKVGLLFPYLRFQDSVPSALIGLFILFIGMRAAWRMTSGIPGAVRHPFAR
jgi:hypothetical protein